MARLKKHSDGLYHCGTSKCKKLIGKKAQVWYGTACKTTGGLMKKDLHYNKHGRIVSRKKHLTAKKEKRLEQHGYFAKKGKFGYVKSSPKKSKKFKKNKKFKKSKKSKKN